MDAEEFRGLSLFSVLPGPLPPVRMLEELVATARSIAHRLGAVVQDEKGADLDGQRLLQLRQSLPDEPQAPGGGTRSVSAGAGSASGSCARRSNTTTSATTATTRPRSPMRSSIALMRELQAAGGRASGTR